MYSIYALYLQIVVELRIAEFTEDGSREYSGRRIKVMCFGPIQKGIRVSQIGRLR